MKNTKIIFTAESAKHAVPILSGLVFFLCGLGVLCGKAFCGELKFRFQPGDKFYLLSVTEQTTTRVVDGNQQVFTQTVRLGCDLDIEEVQADGRAWAKYSYRQAALKLKGPASPDASRGGPAGRRGLAEGGQDVSVEYDSDANQPKISSRALPLAGVLGEGFYIRITPQGRIDKINGLQAVVSSAKSKVPNIPNKDQINQTIDNQFSEAGIKRELENQMAVFPDVNVVTGPASARFGETGDPCLATRVTGDESAFGETSPAGGRRATIWSRTEQMDEEEVMVEWTFRLKESRTHFGTSSSTTSKVPETIGRQTEPVTESPNGCGIAIIDVNIVIRPAAAARETVSGGVRMRREVSGQGAGQIEIDESTGRIINSVLTQDFVDEIKTSSEGPVRRIPPVSEPATRHIVKTFKMDKRPASPAADNPAVSPDLVGEGPAPGAQSPNKP
jgi:hypothetical protein